MLTIGVNQLIRLSFQSQSVLYLLIVSTLAVQKPSATTAYSKMMIKNKLSLITSSVLTHQFVLLPRIGKLPFCNIDNASSHTLSM